MNVVLHKELVITEERAVIGVFNFLVGYSGEERRQWEPDWNVNVDVRDYVMPLPTHFAPSRIPWVRFGTPGGLPAGNLYGAMCTHIAVNAHTDEQARFSLNADEYPAQFERLRALYQRRKIIAEQTHERFMAVRTGARISGTTENQPAWYAEQRRVLEEAVREERQRAARELQTAMAQSRSEPRFPVAMYHPTRVEYGVAANYGELAAMTMQGWIQATGQEEKKDDAPRISSRRIVSREDL